MGVNGYLELHGAYGGVCSVGRGEKELPQDAKPAVDEGGQECASRFQN